jgi:predicted thioesterase
VNAWYGETLIGAGTHGRYVIEIESFKNSIQGL